MMVRRRSLHRLAEELYYALEDDGYFDEAPLRAPRPAPRRSRTARQRTLRIPLKSTKKKRKVSAYQKEFGRQLKKLKRAHPRTPVTKLMKRAHAATKRVRRGK
jgi:hypothetical protein